MDKGKVLGYLEHHLKALHGELDAIRESMKVGDYQWIASQAARASAVDRGISEINFVIEYIESIDEEG